MANNQNKKSEKLKFIETAKARFKQAAEAETDIRKHALEDLKFSTGDQWPEDVKRERDMDNRPCLTINRIPQYIRQVTNDQRQNRPAIKISPVDDMADVETAKVLQGLIRHIEYNSNADIAYDTAFDGAVRQGFGYFRVITDFVDPTSFDQEILIKAVPDHFKVYLDPSYQEPDGSDAKWGFIFEDLTEDEYKHQYPKSKMASMEDWKGLGDSEMNWITEDSCRVAEYFYTDYEDVEIVLLNTKEVVRKDELPEFLPEGIEIVSERMTQVPVVKWCKINAVETLEETTWLGQHIPIVPVLGDCINVDGKKILEGITRHAKDPQRMYNYWASSETESIALAPKAPYVGAEGQFEGHEREWATANRKNHAFLQYKPVNLMGQMAPAPQRQFGEPAVGAITQARMQSSEDLKATTGIYDASMGARSNESSGVAIQRRNHQAQTANFHFVDNLSRSMRHLGRILVDVIPKVYDTPRAARIIGEDDEEELVMLNQLFEKDGEQKQFNLGAGKYDVAVSNGPSYQTKRQEAVESMLSMTQSYPQLAQFGGDLMVKSMDFPMAQELAERIKRTIPPEIIGDKKDQGEVPQEVQMQMQQAQQMIDQLTEQLTDAQDKMENKTLEIESKERMAQLKAETDLRIALLKEDSADSRVALQTEIAQLDRLQKEVTVPGPQQGNGAGLINQPTGGLPPGSPMEN